MTIRGKAKLYRWIGVLTLVLFAAFNSLEEIGMSGNEASRFATVQAVAEQHTFAIERTNFRTVDNLFFDGHLYSDKPPLLSWSVGMLLRPVLSLTGWNFADNYHLLVYLVDLFAGGGVNVLIFWWLFNQFRRVRGGPVEAKFLLALGSVLGSWLLSYSVVLNNHTPAALCVLGIFVALWKYTRRPSFAAAALAALGCGALGALEIPGGVLFSLALVPALMIAAPPERRQEHVLAALCVVLGSALGVFVLNYVAYRRVLPLYIVNGGSFSPALGGKSPWGYALECLFTCRGVFSYQPFLLLALPGVWLLRKKLRSAEWIMLAASALLTAFYLVVTNEYGGAAYGFRYLVPVIPLWSFYAGRWVLAAKRRRAAGVLASALLLWGVATAAAGAYFPFCVAFEGVHSPRGHFTRSVRSTFGGNLLCWSFEHMPESALTRKLVGHYGAEAAYLHLYHSFFSMKRPDMLARLTGIRAASVEKPSSEQYFIRSDK